MELTMTQDKPQKCATANLSLSGRTPVLKTEDPALYAKLHANFMACLSPEDIVLESLIDRLVNDQWFIMRYGRHQTVAIERSFQQSLDFQEQRRNLRKAKKEALAKIQAERMAQSPPEVAQLVHLEKRVGDPIEEIDEILERTPTEIEHNRALERSILFQEQLDRLVNNATKRFNETLELIECYKARSGKRLRQAAEDLNAVSTDQGEAPRQTEGPSIVPSENNTLADQMVDPNPSSSEENR
jgi:hypothetical protein